MINKYFAELSEYMQCMKRQDLTVRLEQGGKFAIERQNKYNNNISMSAIYLEQDEKHILLVHKEPTRVKSSNIRNSSDLKAVMSDIFDSAGLDLNKQMDIKKKEDLFKNISGEINNMIDRKEISPKPAKQQKYKI